MLCFGIFGVPQISCVNPVRQRISKTSRNKDWPDGDLNSTAGDMEPNQETSESQLPSRRLMRKTPPSGVDEKHPDSQIEHVGQTPVDAPSQPTVELETASFFPALGPVSKPTQLSETAEPRAKQPRIGESVSITIANANSVHSTHIHKTLLRQFERLMILCKILKMRKRK